MLQSDGVLRRGRSAGPVPPPMSMISRNMAIHLSVVKSFGPTVFMNFGPGRDRLQIASGASEVAESCGLGQEVAGAAETVRGTLRVAGNGAWDSRAQRLGSGEYAAGGLAVGVDRTRASPWRLRQGSARTIARQCRWLFRRYPY